LLDEGFDKEDDLIGSGPGTLIAHRTPSSAATVRLGTDRKEDTGCYAMVYNMYLDHQEQDTSANRIFEVW